MAIVISFCLTLVFFLNLIFLDTGASLSRQDNAASHEVSWTHPILRDSLINLLLVKAGAKHSDIVCVIFASTIDCSKCIYASNYLLSAFEKTYHCRVRNIAEVQCFREQEMQVFRKGFQWNYPMVHDDGSARKLLGLPDDTRLALYDSSGKLIAIVSADEVTAPNFRIKREFKH